MSTGSLLTISNTFNQFSNFNLIITEDLLFKVILPSSATKEHNAAFYEGVKICYHFRNTQQCATNK